MVKALATTGQPTVSTDERIRVQRYRGKPRVGKVDDLTLREIYRSNPIADETENSVYRQHYFGPSKIHY